MTALLHMRPRWPRALRWVLLIVALVLVVFYLGGGWYFSNMIRDRALDGVQRRAALAPSCDVEAVAVEGEKVTLRVPEDPIAVAKDGTWGVQWPGGYGQAGRILSEGSGQVLREFRHLIGSPLAPGALVALDNRAFPGDPCVSLGISFRDV